ncbi:MAG: chitobiase/beta-hexosaminidase C-terminal domain-containing protein [Lachnospiraceae bacterium]|nr:chitobiase/beta-hexosaminidase C-terminal domain-containing protein [Lachnospiraceae bacterium]
MKCPNCGKEIPDEHLICEHCGTEIQMVPEYIPEEVEVVPEDIDTTVFDEEENSASVTSKLHKQILFILIPVAAILVILVLISVRIYHSRSVNWQYSMAQKAISQQDYELGRNYLETCYELSGEDSTYLLDIASTYDLEGNTSSYRMELEQLSYGKEIPPEVQRKAMEMLCESYISSGEYQRLADFVEGTDQTELYEMYGQYLADPPLFTYPEGVYDESFRVELTSKASGKIYYTIDGSFPTSHSMEYKGPLELDQGSTVVSAVFVNEFGVSSDVARVTYTVEFKIPEPPVINLQSGVYKERRSIVITCEEGCSVYYTVNGSEPNETCRKYTDPIKLPDGVSIFKFVAINDTTFAESNIVSRTYELDAYQ